MPVPAEPEGLTVDVPERVGYGGTVGLVGLGTPPLLAIPDGLVPGTGKVPLGP